MITPYTRVGEVDKGLLDLAKDGAGEYVENNYKLSSCYIGDTVEAVSQSKNVHVQKNLKHFLIPILLFFIVAFFVSPFSDNSQLGIFISVGSAIMITEIIIIWRWIDKIPLEKFNN